MTLNARFILKCALRTARLTYVRCGFGFDHTHRYSQRGQRGSGLDGLVPPPSMWAADALFLCDSWASCYRSFDTDCLYSRQIYRNAQSRLIDWLRLHQCNTAVCNDGALLTWVVCIVIRLGDAVNVRADPLATTLADNCDKLSISTMRPWRCSIFLRTQWRTCVRAVLTRAQQTAVWLEFFTIFVSLTVHVARLRCFCYNITHAVHTDDTSCLTTTLVAL